MSGFSFGATNPGTSTTQGFSFGTPTTSTGSTGFSFGSTSAPGTSTASTGFSFGSTSTGATSTAPTGFNFGSTSTTGTSAGTTGFGFGGAATSGTTTGGTGFSFGTSNPTTSASTFGAPFGTATPVSSTATTQAFSFGGGANQAAKPFSFGTSTNPLGGFGAKPAPFGPADASQQGALGQPDPTLALHLAICTPSYFNNENDEVLRKWNQLQAVWGAGKGYYALNMPPVEFTPENPYCRFKVVCYARIPDYRNEDGRVQIVIGKPLSEVEQHKQQIITTLTALFNGAEVVVEEVFSAKNPSQSIIYMHVLQALPNGGKQRASSTDVYRHMLSNENTRKNLCIQDVIPFVALTEKQMKEYLDTPQRGIDPALWEQGKRENPDPKKFLPVVRVGFQELQMQFKEQEQHAEKLQTEMKEILDSITQLKHKQAMVKAAIQNTKWKQANVTRRVLKLVSTQEVERKRGVPLDQTEEQIRMRLEDLYVQLMQPTQYRGCLNELMAQMSVKPAGSRSCPRYGLVNDKEKDVSQYISWQQEALNAVVNILKEDMQVADRMAEELQRKA